MANFDRKRALLALLADGSMHSGQSLADSLQVTRTAVWKHLQSLQALGLDIRSSRGSGYQLSAPIDLLDEAYLSQAVQASEGGAVRQLEVFFEIESTNQHLLNSLSSGAIHRHVVLAEYQSAGRGRRGNHWLSPVASGLCLSVGWHFEVSPASLMALSLATGVVVVQCLEKFNVEKLGLKWPNDIICDSRKLGGILLESRIEAAGTCDVVLGLGLNIHLPEATSATIEQEITDIAGNCQRLPCRSQLASSLIKELIAMLERYSDKGFAHFISDWRNYDCLRGKQAKLTLAGQQLVGEVSGIDDNGLLQMCINGEIQKFTSGELSIRALT